MKNIYITQPLIPDIDQYNKYLDKIFESRYLSNNGIYLQELENKLKKFMNVQNNAVFCNGTTALMIALKSLNLIGPVITTPFSVTGDTPILYKENNNIDCDTIENIYNKFNIDGEEILKTNNIEVLSIDNSFKCKWHPISYLLRHKNVNKIYEITTYNGYNVKCTGSHSVFVFENELLKYKKIEDIKEGDYLVSYKNIDNNIENEELDLIEYLNDSDLKIYNTNITKTNFDKIKTNIKNVNNIKNVKSFDKNISSYPKQDCFPIKYANYMEKENVKNCYIGGYPNKTFSNMLKIDKDLSFVLGLYIAEGHVTKYSIIFTFHINENNLKNKVINFANKYNFNHTVFLKEKGNSMQIEVYSKLLAILFKKLCYVENSKPSASTKKVPSIVYSLTSENKKSFIRGYYEGDGNIYKNRVTIATVSKNLADGLLFLLSSIGIKANTKVRPAKKLKIHKNKKESICKKAYVITYQFKKTRYGDFENFLPWKQIKEKHSRYSKDQFYVDFKKLPIDMQEKFHKYIDNLCYPRVTKITELNDNKFEYVYDFSVPINENFLGGTGGLLLHNTFPATVNAIEWNNLDVIFADVDYETMNITPKTAERHIYDRASAILPVHVFGNPCDVQGFKELADFHSLKIIYDAAHAFGTEIDGVGIGNFGDITMFSFHPTKLFHTGEGGMLTYNDPELDIIIKQLRNFGIKNDITGSVRPGINGKMNEMQAALGLCILEKINEEIKKRKKIYELYKFFLRDISWIKFLNIEKNISNSYQYFPIRIKKIRNKIYDELKNKNIFSRKYFYPLCNNFEHFKHVKANVPNAVKISEEILCLPFYGDLEESNIEKICKIIRNGDKK